MSVIGALKTSSAEADIRTLARQFLLSAFFMPVYVSCFPVSRKLYLS